MSEFRKTLIQHDLYGPSLPLLSCICIMYRTTVWTVYTILYYSTTHYSIQQSSRTQYLRPFDARRMSSIPLSSTMKSNNLEFVFALHCKQNLQPSGYMKPYYRSRYSRENLLAATFTILAQSTVHGIFFIKKTP